MNGTGDDNNVICARDLGKTYKVYKRQSERLIEWLSFGSVRRHQSFEALRGIDLDVPRGQCLGVIGLNGCGKSTLLKLLSGVLCPTSGSFEVRGRVFALIELGTGFNPYLTGSQNIDLASGLLGLDPEYVRLRKDQIIEFAELEEFIDRPMRTYSSGMRARLSFALYAFMEPDVLMIDEAFSVGDASFREKSYELIERMVRDENRTVVFVSHSIGAIKRLSQRVLWLDKGLVRQIGDADEVTKAYLERVGRGRESRMRSLVPDDAPTPDADECFYRAAGADEALRRAWIELRAGRGAPRAPAYERFLLGAVIRADAPGPSHASMVVEDESGVLVAQGDTERLGLDPAQHSDGAEVVMRWPWRPLGIAPGRYRVRFGLRAAGSDTPPGQTWDAGWFEVTGSRVSDSTYHVLLTPRVQERVDGR